MTAEYIIYIGIALTVIVGLAGECQNYIKRRGNKNGNGKNRE